MKTCIMNLITQRKPCFTNDWQGRKLNNIGTKHPIAHLQLLAICLILTKQMPKDMAKLQGKAMVANLGQIFHGQKSTATSSIAKSFATGGASFDSHIMTLTVMQYRQLDDLFRPPVPPQGGKSKLTILSNQDKPIGKAHGDTLSKRYSGNKIVSVPLEILDVTQFQGTRGVEHLFITMNALYQNLNQVRANPAFKRYKSIKLEIRAKERDFRYLDFIVNQGID